MMHKEVSRIKYSPQFLRSAKKLPRHIQTKLEARELIFKNNAFDTRLETHKLHGKNREAWAYSIDHSYRVKFLFNDNGSVLYIKAGTHDEVY
ncbi:MAG: type II toxin-antitoxin system mRNA interferase toxin, RelE/StbE family [Parcubacteria group bacterium]|nr:type II toxin-antitoxin system mRNA interferase toxin, RelE/StbE family [Parcubacteria group bacterium]